MTHADLHISLGLDVRSPSCTGWVLDVRQNEGYDPIVDRVPVPPDVAVQVAELLDRLTGSNCVSQAVRANNAAAVSRLDDLASAAAAAAARAEMLAGKAAAFRSGMASPPAPTPG